MNLSGRARRRLERQGETDFRGKINLVFPFGTKKPALISDQWDLPLDGLQADMDILLKWESRLFSAEKDHFQQSSSKTGPHSSESGLDSPARIKRRPESSGTTDLKTPGQLLSPLSGRSVSDDKKLEPPQPILPDLDKNFLAYANNIRQSRTRNLLRAIRYINF